MAAREVEGAYSGKKRSGLDSGCYRCMSNVTAFKWNLLIYKKAEALGQ